ncbi:hypothetical protein D3C78_1374770 [compost metagenome]
MLGSEVLGRGVMRGAEHQAARLRQSLPGQPAPGAILAAVTVLEVQCAAPQGDQLDLLEGARDILGVYEIDERTG